MFSLFGRKKARTNPTVNRTKMRAGVSRNIDSHANARVSINTGEYSNADKDMRTENNHDTYRSSVAHISMDSNIPRNVQNDENLYRHNSYHNVYMEKNPVYETEERIQTNLDKDDFLLNQIDEFREKAKQLQQMLSNKESKANELQYIVEEREEKAEELQMILEERQEKVDGITAQVERQIDVLIERVNLKMQEIEASMGAEMQTYSDNVAQSVKSIANSTESMKNEISDKVDATLKETKVLSEEQAKANEQMLNSLGELSDELVTLKQEISEKVHSENVMCYRNIQDLFKEMEAKVDTVSVVEQGVRSTKGFAVATFILAMINTFGIVAVILFSLGIINIF